jgi:hypothetical protein
MGCRSKSFSQRIDGNEITNTFSRVVILILAQNIPFRLLEAA